MLFDWFAYRAVAETLKGDMNEASQRSAISRAYYFAYHQALSHLAEHHNFQLSEDKPAHDQVWREFSGKGLSYREVWNKGDKLKKLRVDADHRSGSVIGVDATDTALKLADRVVE
ncbi:MAG: hypothetical protein AB7U82_22455 [Blastocatellales bacterium]